MNFDFEILQADSISSTSGEANPVLSINMVDPDQNQPLETA